jgi:Fe-S-cluster containining protein
MTIKIDPFVPSETCLACDGCCRYAEHDSIWAPVFLFEEIVALTEKNLVPTCLFTHPASKAGREARINLVEAKGQWVCPCLSVADTTCKIYGQRPLDCRLYPFLLVRKEGRASLAIDEKCPYAQKNIDSPRTREVAAALIRILKSPEVSAVLKKNPGMIQAYPSDYRILEPLPF